MKKFSDTINLENVVQLLQVHAEISSDKIITNATSLTSTVSTCHQLNIAAKQLAAVLQEIARGEQKVVLFYASYEEALPVFFATWYAGLTAVPVDFAEIQLHPNYLPNLMAAIEPVLFLTTQSLYAAAQNMLSHIPEFQNAWHILTDEIVASQAKWRDPIINDASIALLQFHYNGINQSAKLVETTHFSLMHDTLALAETEPFQQTHLPMVSELLKTVHQCKELSKDVMAVAEEEAAA